ncbi:MAG: ribosomal-protein-alanine N-acetyltransferase [Mariniblastus sp.]|jgi:ribosomal-protein-alanine N-acetyltransferase
MITTNRLTLIPHSAELLRAEIGDHVELARLLATNVSTAWPPESTVDALPFFLDHVESSSHRVGWSGWYAVTKPSEQAASSLVGGGGFMGSPNEGSVQIGYSVITEHQGAGYATEIVGGLIEWAFGHSDCSLAVAETEWKNPQSVRVLVKNGFVQTGAVSETGGSRFELSAQQRPL